MLYNPRMDELRQRAVAIGPGIWWMDEFSLVNAFLVEGDERSAVIDTCCGLGNIREVAEALTDKPLSVLLTHSHPDHIGGIYHFRDVPVFMNSRERLGDVFGLGSGNAFRRTYVSSRGPQRCPDIYRELYALIPTSEPDPSFNWTAIEDGSVIDLGGRFLRCILTPGHTDGSICFLDDRTGILFSGDTVNSSIILPRLEGDANDLIELYGRTLSRLWQEKDSFSSLAIGHGGPVIDKAIIGDYLHIVEGILSGSAEGRYEEAGFRRGVVARYGSAELWYRCDQ